MSWIWRIPHDGTTRRRLAAILVGLACAGSPVIAGGQVDAVSALTAEALHAYRAKDYARFLAAERRALALEPANPRLLYDVACGESLTGQPTAAVRTLEQLAARKLDLGAETDPDLAAARRTPEWKTFAAQLAALRRPLVRSSVAFTLPDPGLLAAGVAVDPQNGDVYVASVRERKIVRRTADGTVSDFITAGQDGFLAGASLALDLPRHLLYATTSAVPFMMGYRPEDRDRSGVFAFDLATGRLVRKVFLPTDHRRHFLNALAVSRTGIVFVADSGSPGIYRLAPGADDLEGLTAARPFRSTQGLALSADDRTLYVADYADGLRAIDLATGAVRRIAAPAGVWLGGLDGLSPVPGGFVAVQIGVRPERVLGLRLDPQGRRLTAVDILEMNHPDYAGPVQGALDRGAFLYVANSQLALGNPATGAFDAARARPTVVLRLPVG
ncbi:MAG: hypothetical protein KGN76_05190 [Acidobacteriota bacterium]|nr:hypothetical protein [Acidobacteriota bacterium]